MTRAERLRGRARGSIVELGNGRGADGFRRGAQILLGLSRGSIPLTRARIDRRAGLATRPRVEEELAGGEGAGRWPVAGGRRRDDAGAKEIKFGIPILDRAIDVFSQCFHLVGTFLLGCFVVPSNKP